jgi:deoxycytidylate deaminase
MPTPYEAMQAAVDVVLTSEHHKNKIASCLFTEEFFITTINHRPQIMCDHLSPDIRIGKSSQFIHSEVACIHAFQEPTGGASLCVTDPFCPNCAKAIVEAGIAHVYIDHKGLDKDFATRRGDEFENLSLFMMEKAGIDVSILYRKDNKIEPLLQSKIKTRSAGASDIEFFDIANDLSLEDMMYNFRNRQPHGAWACARISEPSGKLSGILVFEALPHGITPQEFEEKKNFSEKYALTIDPVNRLCFYLKRKGLKLADMEIGVNQFPSSRAMVNAVGFGIQKLFVGENVNKPGLNRYDGAKILEENGILEIRKLY